MPFSRVHWAAHWAICFRAPWGVRFRTSLLFLCLATVAIVLAACSNDPEPTPTAIATATATIAPPTPTPVPVTPTPTVAPTAIPEEPAQTLEDLLSSIERDIENLRGIDTPPPVEHMFVDQAGVRERLAEEFEDPEVVEQIAHESVLLKLLGVIPQDSGLAAVYERMLGGQVLGLYDPEKEQFFVLRDDESGAESLDVEAQLTNAHEYVHRLQDAAFDLEAITDLESSDHMSIAISALVEGDATTAQTQYMFQNFDFRELSELLESALAAQEEITPAPYFSSAALNSHMWKAPRSYSN